MQPRGSRYHIGKALGKELQIKVMAAPVNAAANAALLELLAETLNCPRSVVQIFRGQTSRHKIVKISGLNAMEVVRKLSLS